MKFLHEYMEYGDGIKRDNGYWAIQGNRLVNRKGGYHFYKPSEDDEIIEADSWKDVLKISLRNDKEVTGWIAPDGEFFGCEPQDHELMADVLFGCGESTLIHRGYMKIYEIPGDVRILMHKSGSSAHRYEAMETVPFITEAQRETLEKKGFVNKDGLFWIMN